MDFRGEPFKPMPKLLAVSEHITKLQAVCSVCGSPSSRTQRLINGEPAKKMIPSYWLVQMKVTSHVVEHII